MNGFLKLAALFLPPMVGCAPRAARPSPGDQNVLTREEILNSPLRDRDLLDALRDLRPRFVRTAPGVHSRASSGSLPPVVYVDGVRQSGIEALATIQASYVEEVRYLSPVAAQNEFGAAAAGGALMITLHRDGDTSPRHTQEISSATVQ